MQSAAYIGADSPIAAHFYKRVAGGDFFFCSQQSDSEMKNRETEIPKKKKKVQRTGRSLKGAAAAKLI